MQYPFILTNHPGHAQSPTWAKLAYRPDYRASSRSRALNSFLQAYHLFRLRLSYKVVVLGGGAREDMMYLILQRLWPFKPRPIIKIDCLWYESPPLKQFFKRGLLKWIDRVVNCYVVWASREINDYSRVFGIPRRKFVFVPYHTTVNLAEINICNKGYIFSGGNFARDYGTLAAAVAGLDADVVIACSNKKALQGIHFPENVTVVNASHEEFMRLMAESAIVVVPLSKGLLHSGGQQTFLNAMAMGKPVIVTDPQGARDYIKDQSDGILVPPSNPESLRYAIEFLYRDPGFAMRLGRKAREKAIRLDTERNLSAIVALSEKVTSSCEDKP